MSRLPCR